MTAVAKGHGHVFRNAASPVVDEYIARKRMAKLGYTAADFDRTPAEKIDQFMIIDCEIERLREPRPDIET